MGALPCGLCVGGLQPSVNLVSHLHTPNAEGDGCYRAYEDIEDSGHTTPVEWEPIWICGYGFFRYIDGHTV